MSLKRAPIRARSPRPSQQIRAGRPWNATRSDAMRIQRARRLVVGELLQHGPVGGADVGRVA